MNVVDLHPEELIDKRARGELGSEDGARLDAHLARCPACRFELQLRADFDEELSVPEEDIFTSQEIVALASADPPRPGLPSSPALPEMPRATAEAPRADEPPRASERASMAPEPAAAPPVWLPRRRRFAVWQLAVAAVLVVGAAAAGQPASRAWLKRVVEDGLSLERAPLPRAPASPVLQPTAARTSVPVVTRPPEKEPIAEPSVLASAAEPKVLPPETAAPMRAPLRPTASALFDEASAARRRGDYDRAVSLHEQLLERYPRSREAHTSRATTGKLMLDRGDPAAALRSFDGYHVGGGGELDEAVLVGRATALERLGRADEARRVWQDLLAAFPQSPYAEHARSRSR